MRGGGGKGADIIAIQTPPGLTHNELNQVVLVASVVDHAIFHPTLQRPETFRARQAKIRIRGEEGTQRPRPLYSHAQVLPYPLGVMHVEGVEEDHTGLLVHIHAGVVSGLDLLTPCRSPPRLCEQPLLQGRATQSGHASTVTQLQVRTIRPTTWTSTALRPCLLYKTERYGACRKAPRICPPRCRMNPSSAGSSHRVHSAFRSTGKPDPVDPDHGGGRSVGSCFTRLPGRPGRPHRKMPARIVARPSTQNTDPETALASGTPSRRRAPPNPPPPPRPELPGRDEQTSRDSISLGRQQGFVDQRVLAAPRGAC